MNIKTTATEPLVKTPNPNAGLPGERGGVKGYKKQSGGKVKPLVTVKLKGEGNGPKN